MRLSFQSPHLSIRAFPEIDLPQFALIVGLNGSGKSHLLQAILNNAVRAGNGNHVGGTRLLTNVTALQQSPVIGQDQTQPGMSLHRTPAGMPMDVDSAKFGVLQEFFLELSSISQGRIEAVTPNVMDIWSVPPAQVVERLGNAGIGVDPAEIARIYEAAAQRLATPTMPWPFPYSPSAFATIARKLDKPVLHLSNADLAELPHWGASDLFSANMAMLFRNYRDERLKNKLRKLDDQENGSKTALSNAQFRERFGDPPWNLLNETLHSFKLPYQVLPPEPNSTDPVHLVLKKDGSGDVVDFSQLSSGETVLLSFAMATFTYDEALVSVNRPGLLLLDELDASLHPEMVQRWLGAVIGGLVERQGISVIATTHSPTTVALAPEESLYEMIDGTAGLRKIVKQAALDRLTYGVPTLSIDYSGRRQVFVESDTDASIFDSCYALIKSRLESKRSLSFISTGMRDKDAVEINSGCTIVTNIVTALEKAGNRAVYGLVDWDGAAVSTARIKVLAEGRRNGVENVLLDPLLVALLLIRNDRTPPDVADLAASFTGLDALSQPQLQRLADCVQSRVLPNDPGSELEPVTYLNGVTLTARRTYLRADDHELEEGLKDAFPFLRKFSHRRGQLVLTVVKEVIRDYPGFCPMEMKLAFDSISDCLDGA